MMRSSTLARFKCTFREAKRQQPSELGTVSEPSPANTNNAINSEATDDDNASAKHDRPASPVGLFSSKKVIRGLKNRARQLSRSEGQLRRVSEMLDEAGTSQVSCNMNIFPFELYLQFFFFFFPTRIFIFFPLSFTNCPLSSSPHVLLLSFSLCSLW